MSNKIKNNFNNPVSKMFFLVLFFDVLFLGFAKEDTIHFIVSITFTLIASGFYIFILFSQNLETKKNLYIGMFGLYEAVHCGLLVSLRIATTPAKFFVFFGAICVISKIFILIFELLFGKKEKSSKVKGVAAIFFLPFGGLGIYLHRILEEKSFIYIPELILVSFYFIFLLFYICIIQHRVDTKTIKSQAEKTIRGDQSGDGTGK